MVELLAHHGADLSARRPDGRTPHTLAALHCNDTVADWLLAHGARDELSVLERFVAACARGDVARARALLRSQPQLSRELTHAHHLLLHRHAVSGRADVLAAPLVWTVEGRRNANEAGADHVAVARLLIAAGCATDWTPPEAAPSPEGTLEKLAELVRAARKAPLG